MNLASTSGWGADWAWGLPLIVLTVMFHAAGLGWLKRGADRIMPFVFRHQTLSIGVVTLLITLLHGVEVFIWAVAFRRLEALPDKRTAILYSMNALTAFGHTDVKLERMWQLLGAMESLNGWILFGLSTAYLFALIQQIWSNAQPGISIVQQISEFLVSARESSPHKGSH